jgi:TRAP-type uncharacterized transport system substrate-binding protein
VTDVRLSYRCPRTGLVPAVVLCLVVASSSCSRRQATIVVTPDSPGEAIAVELAELLREEVDFDLRIIEGEGSIRNLDGLRSGEADLTVVENSVPFQRGIRTVLPLYPSVLHVLHETGEKPRNFRELVEGKRVWLGARGGLSEWFVELVRRHVGVPSHAFTIVEDRKEIRPHVIVAFGMLDPSISKEIAAGYEFYSGDRPEDLGRGSVADGISARFPQMRPFIIPKRYYGDGNPDPVVTVSVDNYLVTRAGFSDVEIYDLARTVFEHKQRLATVNPVLVSTVTEDFDEETLTFPLHTGVRQYLNRNEPGILERYAELAGVTFTVFLASASGLIALARWRKRRRKDRIDVFYRSVIEQRTAGLRSDSSEDVEAVISRLRELQDEAFGLLIDERLAADESFRIFVTLTQEAIEELRQHRDALSRGED